MKGDPVWISLVDWKQILNSFTFPVLFCAGEQKSMICSAYQNIMLARIT